jgi:hypothetical protein
MSLFVHPQELSWLKDDGYEGIVFYFGHGKLATPAKLVDPMFTKGLAAKKEEQSNFTQMFNDTLHNIVPAAIMPAVDSFIQSPEYSNDDMQQLFIDFIAHLTRQILTTQGPELHAQFAPYHNEAMKRRFSNITYSLIPSYIKRLANTYWFTEEIFAALLSMLQKPKVRINLSNGLTKERKELVNNMVQQLKDKRILNVDL